MHRMPTLLHFRSSALLDRRAIMSVEILGSDPVSRPIRGASTVLTPISNPPESFMTNLVASPAPRQIRVGMVILRAVALSLALTLIGVLSSTDSEGATTPGAAELTLFRTANAWQKWAPSGSTGWKVDFYDNFSTPLRTSVWGRYMSGVPAGTTSAYLRDNATVTRSPLPAGGGVLQLHTIYRNGHWTSAGLSSGRGFAAIQGMWSVKAKFDRANGVGYAMLLYPQGGAWPPEIDFAEGTAGGPSIMGTVHYGTARQNFQIQRWLRAVDMSRWHVYGVSITNTEVDYLLDGKIWARVHTTHTPRVPMWLGVQAGVKDCRVSTGECLSGSTPKSSAISIDWVAHYKRS